jgi:predicted DNA-binding protein with PD1-like motif
MEWKRLRSDIFVRLDQGDRLVESLRKVGDEATFPAAAILSGVGMLNGIQLGFFDTALDDYRRTDYEGIFDLSVVIGNIVQGVSGYVPHVHAVFNDTLHATLSGHVMEATCHITMEIFLGTNAMDLHRVTVPGCPATRIVFGKT